MKDYIAWMAFLGVLLVFAAAAGVFLNAPPNTEVLGVLSVAAATGFVGVAALLYAILVQLAAISKKLEAAEDDEEDE